MKTAVMACMRDEAPFILEWVAYQHVIGFDLVFLVTNNCHDTTQDIADRLEALGLARHIRNDDHGDTAPQIAGVDKVLNQPDVQTAEWLLHCDADEFLNIHHGAGLLSDLLPVIEPFDAGAVAWRLFGDAGLARWPGGLVTEQLTRCATKPTDFTSMQKTIFRPQHFAGGIDHMPKKPLKVGLRLCNMRGHELNADALYDPGSSDHRIAFGREINRKRRFGFQGAQLNHYATRSEDCFLMKNVRGDGKQSRHNKRYFLHSRWHRAANKNDVEDISIHRHLPALVARLADWRDDARLKALDATALDAFQAHRDAHLTPENIHRWTNWSAVERQASA